MNQTTKAKVKTDKRDIKFRAWFDGPKLMGNVITLKGSNRTDYDSNMWDEVIAECYVDGRQHFYSSYNFTLMQYTGLNDKNGKEIYEGDIIAWDFEYDADYDGDMPIVKRRKGKAAIRDIFDRHDIKWAATEGPGCEVIGNIYENPELLIHERI